MREMDDLVQLSWSQAVGVTSTVVKANSDRGIAHKARVVPDWEKGTMSRPADTL